MIFGCSYMFLGWPCIKYVRNWWWWGVGWGGGWDGGCNPKCVRTAAYRGKRISQFLNF